MSNVVNLNGNLEMRDEAGRTVHYAVLSADQLQALQAECERLRERVAVQERRIEELGRDNERLKEETRTLAAERDGFYRWYTEQLREEFRKYPEAVAAEWEALIAGIQQNGADLAETLKELEADFGGVSPGKKDVL